MAVSGSAEALPGGRLAGRRALVTGAASGIGLATARRLRYEGARVAGVDRHWPDELDEPEMHRLTADVTCAGQVTHAVQRAAELLGGPSDVLVNAAGVYR